MTNKKIGAGIISSFFVFLCACTGCSGSANVASATPSIKRASSDSLEPVQKTDPGSEELELFFPGNEEASEISSTDLNVAVSASTTTPTSQSYTVNFSSQTRLYYGINTSNRNVYIAIDDDTDINSLPTEEERKEGLAEGEEDSGPEALTGYVFSITNEGTTDPVIPYQYYSGTRATVDIIGIGSSVVDSNFVNSINSIYIPSSIETIDPNAFTNLEDKGVTFKLGFDEDEDLSFDVDDVFPSGCTVIFEGHGAEDRRQGISSSKASSGDHDIFIGTEETFTGQDYQDDLRLGLQYDVYNSEEEYVETRLCYFPVSSTNSNTDSIGTNMGRSSLVLYFDIDLNEGEKIDNESLVFFNIYFASCITSEEGGNYYYPDLNYPYVDSSEEGEETVEYYVGQMYCVPRLSYSIEDDISNYIDYSFGSLNTFSGYSAFVMNVSKADYDVYPALKKSSYQNNLPNIENGTLQIRYRLTSLTSAYYRIGYINEDGELDSIDIKVDTPISYSKINTKGNNELSFLIHNKDIYQGFKVSDIRSVDIIGLRITIDLYNKSRNSVISKSSVETRFGIINVMEYTDVAPSFTNINLILILLFVGYTVVFLAAALGIYFYRKNKFKNDEFRRMDTRKFINQAIIAYIFIGLLVFFVATLLIRVMPLKNAVVTYNPIDVYLFFFAIGAIIAIGYYIRYFWLAGKAARHRKEVERLKLNKDEEDDGTGTDIN